VTHEQALRGPIVQAPKEMIGLIFQTLSLIPVLSAFENVEYPQRAVNIADRRAEDGGRDAAWKKLFFSIAFVAVLLSTALDAAQTDLITKEDFPDELFDPSELGTYASMNNQYPLMKPRLVESAKPVPPG